MAPAFNIEVISIAEIPPEAVDVEVVIVGPKRPVVLVVDDEPIVADTLGIVLAKAGYETLTAYSPLAALELAKRVPPAFLISDVQMPEMNGIELAMRLVKSSPGCRVLLFSGNATTMDLVEARAAGYDFPLLAKPVHPREIIAYISKHIESPAKVVTQTRVQSVASMQGLCPSA